MFDKKQTVDTRMAVIEEKFTVYEKMMDKLESAIQAITEINQNISRLLSVHEEKIDHVTKTDDIIFDKIKRLEEKNTEEHKKVIEKIEKFEEGLNDTLSTEKKATDSKISALNTKITDITKFRWLVVGGLVTLVFVFTNPHIIVDILTPDQDSVKIEKVN